MSGDTIMEGVEWKKLQYIRNDMTTAPTPCGYVRENTLNEVYLKLTKDCMNVAHDSFKHCMYMTDYFVEERTFQIYDFGAKTGEAYSNQVEPFVFETTGIRHEENGGDTFRIFDVVMRFPEDRSPMMSDSYVEGVGTVTRSFAFYMPMAPLVTLAPSPSPELLWVTDCDGNVYYEGAGGYKPWDPAGVYDLQSVSHEVVGTYDLSGRAILNPTGGIFIEIYNDGSARKVMRLSHACVLCEAWRVEDGGGEFANVNWLLVAFSP